MQTELTTTIIVDNNQDVGKPHYVNPDIIGYAGVKRFLKQATVWGKISSGAGDALLPGCK